MAEKQRSERKRGLGIDVLTAAQRRIAEVFDTFPVVYLSGPSGKDSGAMMHLVCLEARRRGRKVGVLYLDLEAQYKVTIEHVREMFALYADVIDPYWLAIPLHLRNAVSVHEPYWICWDPTRAAEWVRSPPPEAITDWSRFPFYRPPWERDGRREAMEFEEFVEDFGAWYSGGKATACFVGIRSDESLNRWRTISGDKHRFEGRCWTTWKGRTVFNAYPIYDWSVEDVWTYFGRSGLPYNRLYDAMHLAGLSPAQMRICQPYGDDQRRGLALYHVIEPETWGRVVARVAGANMGALYAGKSGNILGNRVIIKPAGYTWESYTRFLLDSLPASEREHYETKFSIFLRWYEERGYPDGIPDEADPSQEAARKVPSWRRLCKVVLKNDHVCKGIGFSQHKSDAYENYMKVQRRRRAQWEKTGL